jgi:hypothetical protein
MTRDDFERSLLLYGADLARWPVDEAAAARSLMESDDAARALHDEINALDTTLRTAVAPDHVGSAEVGRVLAGIERTRHQGHGYFGRWRLAATGMALAASVAGFAVGFLGETGSVAPEDDVFMAVEGLELEGSDMDMWGLL